MIWTVLIIAVIAVAAYMALQYAIGRNGPAVLDNVDRLTGGERDVALVHKEALSDSAANKIAVYAPDGDVDQPRPVVVFVHGGSWASGDPDDYGFVARALVPEGYVVVLAGYRLYPDSKFPGMLEDTAAAVAWTKSNIERFGGDAGQIYLSGHSAGAYNVVKSVLDRQWLGREGLTDSDVAGVIALAGPFDFYPFDSESTKNSFGHADEPEKTQPINFARGDAPPMLFLHGELDTTVYPRNSRVLEKAITEDGGKAEAIFYPEMDHTAILTAIASPWRRDRRVIDAINEFIAEAKASVPVQGETR